MATTTGRYLTEEQIAGYHADGYLVLPRVIDMADVQALRRGTDAFVERSRRLSRGDGVLDLDPRHTARIHTHFDGEDRFVGCMRREDIERLDVRAARLLAMLAGGITIHHYRLVHWSAPNASATERRLLINAYSAADAVQLVPDATG